MRELSSIISRDIYSQNPNVKWDDIVGLDDAKRLLKEAVVMPIKYPKCECFVYFATLLSCFQAVFGTAVTVEGCSNVWPARYRQDSTRKGGGNRVQDDILQHQRLDYC